ncbi:hypothetical protein CHE218_16160 [Microbacterium sp. che218]
MMEAALLPLPGQAPPRSHARVGSASVLLLIYAAVVAAMTMSPTPLDRGYQGAISRFLAVLHRNGVPEWFGYPQLEFSANIAMFVPLGFLVGLVVPRRFFWLALVIVPATSAVIEVLQGLFLSQRFASVFDVLANTIGGYIGVAIVIVLRVFVEGRDRKIVARALWERNVAMMNAQRAAVPPRPDSAGPRPAPRTDRR